MCGIIGCNGVEGAASAITQGLERLEYRGYDSAGIAIIDNKKIRYEKKKGRISVLIKALKTQSDFVGSIGIGHTRWATHGKPSDENAHPHISGKFAVVHNGIIENYRQLKEKYLKLVSLKSDTDTEIIVQLLNRLYNGDCLETLSNTAKLLEGSFAIAVLCEDEPDTLYCVRKSSPLLIGVGNGVYAASDLSAINDRIHTLYRMNDGEIAVISKTEAEFYTFDKKKIVKNPEEFEKAESNCGKENYEHYMLKEIYEQPAAVQKTVDAYLENKKIRLDFELNKPERIYIVACGSAYHAGLAGKRIFEELLKFPVIVQVASEFRYSNPLINENTPTIIISQSGETADSLAALREAKSMGAKTISIVNVRHSSIAAESDYVLLTRAGQETAVATTKAYSAQLAALYMLGIYFAEKFGTADSKTTEKLKSQLETLHTAILSALDCEKQIKELAQQLQRAEHIYFIGRGLGYAAACEGSLKLKEISYIHCEAYAAGEMKHGTISLIEKGTNVIAADTEPKLSPKLQSNIDEVVSRGARVTAITSQGKIKADSVIKTPAVNELFAVSTQIVPLQLLSYHIARLRGCDIDKPRNLAKSVTVE